MPPEGVETEELGGRPDVTNRTNKGWMTVGVLATALGVALAAGPRAASSQSYVPTTDLNYPKVRYADSLVSLNDHCPVRHGRLNPAYVPVYVNGRPVGFC
jgi:hypothetical protein